MDLDFGNKCGGCFVAVDGWEDGGGDCECVTGDGVVASFDEGFGVECDGEES